jgi:molybdopterin-containing oxidoreductase family membrane subunit
MSESTMTAGTSVPAEGRVEGKNAERSAAEHVASPAKKSHWGGKGLTVAIVVTAIVMCIGIALWMVQLSGGMVQTGMRNRDSWGLYLINFMLFVGLSTGASMMAAFPVAFGMKGFGDISKVAIWASICCACAAIGFVVVDLGGPARLWELFVYSNLSSPLMWDVISLGIYLVMSIVYLLALVRNQAGRTTDASVRVLSVIMLVVSVFVLVVDAGIFSLAPSQEYLHTALMGPWFIVSAIDSGAALVLILALVLRKSGYVSFAQHDAESLGKIVAVFVCVDILFYVCDLLTNGYYGGSGAEIVAMLTTGALAPVFWTQMVLMAIALVLFFAPKLHSNGGMILASVLVIVAVFCKRVQILVGGFQLPNVTMGDVANPMTMTDWESGIVSMGYNGPVYTPTGIEFGVAIGVIAMGLLFLFLGLKYLPLQQVAKQPGQPKEK